jgi:hypothetical protein
MLGSLMGNFGHCSSLAVCRAKEPRREARAKGQEGDVSLSSARERLSLPQARPSPRVPSGLLTCDGLAASQGRTPSA